MTNEFRDCFVGEKGYEALKKLMKNGNEFCIDVAKCLQDRSDAEIAYAKALRKNSDALQKLAGRAKETLAQAFTTLAIQTSKECDAHSSIAGILLNDICIPMKNLAEKQSKDRKSIEDTLNGKFKELNAQKEVDNKYRSRQFEKSKEIETLALKISELSTATKSSAKTKASSVSVPLVMGCVLPAGRHTSASEKSTSYSDTKYHSNLEASIQKAGEELIKIERKYHTSTKDVELVRQACDLEMYRGCDQMQKMEFDRINEMGNFIQTFTTSIQTLSDTMYHVSQDLYSIQIVPDKDITTQARSNVQPTDVEILLYDIYAEDKNNVMNEQRRILSLMGWMEILRRDIEIQQQSKNASFSSLSSAPQNSNRDESPDDDRGSSSDGAMCSSTSSHSKTDIVLNAVHHQDASSSSSNDDDGAMNHTKREKKKKEGVKNFSSELFIDRRGAGLLLELYKASLYKIESVYNYIKGISEPRYEHVQRITRTSNDKGYPTTLLRIPCQTPAYTPASAPSATQQFVQAMPMYAPTKRQQPVSYTVQRQAPPPGWTTNEASLASTAPADQPAAYRSAYPVLMAQPPVIHVRALYSYTAKHTDELNLEPGDIIVLLERRQDEWFKGNLNGQIGLFPGNFVEEV